MNLRPSPEIGLFCVEREVNIGWPALKKSLWKERLKSFGKIFKRMSNQHCGDTLII
jgi:hypothetical protein